MISIGLTSGLGSIAYSVVTLSSAMKLTDFEVMPGPRKKRNVPKERRYRAHSFMFDAIFSRWPPAVIGLGPPSSDDEPDEWVSFMRTSVAALGGWRRVPVFVFDTPRHVARRLGAEDDSRGNGLKSLIKNHMGRPFPSNERRVILATATALAAAIQVRETASREVSSGCLR